MTPRPSKAPLRTKTPSPLLRFSQSKQSHPTQNRAKPSNLAISTSTSISKTCSNLNPKKQPCSKPQKPHRTTSQDIPSPTYIPLAKVQGRMTTTKVPTAITTANARARKQPSHASMGFPLTFGFGTFIMARLSPLSAVGKAGIAWGLGCA